MTAQSDLSKLLSEFKEKRYETNSEINSLLENINKHAPFYSIQTRFPAAGRYDYGTFSTKEHANMFYDTLMSKLKEFGATDE